MSRRSNLSTLGRQRRAASRMTPGTSMWSEQMFSNPIMRPAQAAEPEVVQGPTGWGQYLSSEGAFGGPPSSPWNPLPGGWISSGRTAEELAGKHLLWFISGSAISDVQIPSGWDVIHKGQYSNMAFAVATAVWSPGLSTVVTHTPGDGFGGWVSRIIAVDAGGWEVLEIARRSSVGGGINLKLVQPGGQYRFQVIFAAAAYANMWTIGPPPLFGAGCMGSLMASTETYPRPPEIGWAPIDVAHLAVCDDGEYSHSSIGAYGVPSSVTFNVEWGSA